MSARVFLHETARSDLIENFAIIGRESLDSADHFLAQVKKAIDCLLVMPLLGSPRGEDPSSLPDLRCWPVPDFEESLVFYRPVKEGVEILRVLHETRDLGNVPQV